MNLGALYPSSAQGLANLDAAEAARAALAAAPQPSPAPAVSPDLAAPPAAQGAPQPAREAPAPASEGEAKSGAEQVAPADGLYDRTLETRTLVKWEEPPAAAADIRLQAPLGEQATPEILADRGKFIEGLAAAGAGVTFANEIWQDALAANSRPSTSTREECMVELRRTWGSATDAKIAVVRAMVQRVAAIYPAVTSEMDRLGLGNNPTFIRKLAARAAALERQRPR